MGRKSYSPEFKFEAVLRALTSKGRDSDIASERGVHPVTLSHWKQRVLTQGPALFSEPTRSESERDEVRALRRALERSEQELAMLRRLAASQDLSRRVEWVNRFRDNFGLERCLAAFSVAKSTYYSRVATRVGNGPALSDQNAQPLRESR